MAATSKAEYLKRYLSENAEEKKKKRRKKVQHQSAIVKKSRIVDDDIDFKSLLPENLGNTLEDDVGDNDPTVVDVIDERPEHIKLLEKYRSSGAWKTMDDKDKNDQSPPRRQRHDSDSDHSPPRSRQRHDSDQSPPRSRQRHDSDQSPPRRQRQDSDQSPPRRKRHDSDQSPPRRQRKGSDSDQSPPRRQRKGSDSDQSPPRRQRKGSDSDQSPPRKKRSESKSGSKVSDTTGNKGLKSDKGRDKLTLGGKKAGLQSARDMRIEAEELKQKDEEQFRKITDERLGKGSDTVFRDKSGRRRNLEDEQEKDAEEDRKKAKQAEKYQKWGKGLKQIEAQNEAVRETLHEVEKPLARFKDDKDLDKMLRDMNRAEDPMLAFLTKKKSSTKSSIKEKPRYKGPAPAPNRFGIAPGYRWDGVDRSNGFEKQIYSKMADRKAVSEQAYKWSIEDM